MKKSSRMRGAHGDLTGAPRLSFGLRSAQSQVDAYFQRESQFWDEVYRGKDVYSAIHRLRHEMALRWIDELGLPAGAQVLELGCGAGFMAVTLAQRGLRVLATDVVEAMLERARANAARAGAGDRVRFVVADAQALQFPDQSVDLVVALGVIPWLPAPGAALAEIARVTKAGGAVVVNMDNAARAHYMLDPKFNPHLAPARAALKSLLRRPSSPSGVRSRLHSIGEFDTMLDAAGLTKVRGQQLGFGPFTALGRPVVPDVLGVWLHEVLQRRSDRQLSGPLATRAAQYLVLAKRREPGAALSAVHARMSIRNGADPRGG
jgi:ubiquinone/menaquinone biosynthesis C-methylase UbiE